MHEVEIQNENGKKMWRGRVENSRKGFSELHEKIRKIEVLRIQLRSDNMSMEKGLNRVRVQREGVFNLFSVHEVMR